MVQTASTGRASDVRFIGAVLGRYRLASRRDLSADRVQVFACRLQSISPKMLVASAPVLGSIDEEVATHFDPFGAVRGNISRIVDGGFCVDIAGTDEDRDKLALKINWLKKRTFAGLGDKREHKRTMPRDPRSAVIFADGIVIPCLIIDQSASGVAVSADIDPEIGLPLAVGRVVGRVVRRLDVGFAVQFLAPQAPEMLEELLHLPVAT